MTTSSRDILVHRVIARLNVGGPAMHVVLLTREFEGRPVKRPRSGPDSGSDSGPDSGFDSRPRSGSGSGSDSTPATFHARLIAGSVMESEGDMAYLAADQGVEVTRVEAMSRSLSPLRDLRSFLELWRLFRRERPDIVHTHTAKAGALGRLAAALAGVPVRIHTYHGHVLGGDYFSRQRTAFFRGVEQLLSILTHRLVVLTESQRRAMSGRLAVAGAEKFAVVPLGLELASFVPGVDQGRGKGRGEARSALGLDPDDLAIGIVGRLVPIKNHELLFDAVSILVDRLAAGDPEAPSVRVLVVGSGEREEALKGHVRRRDLEGRVLWLGWRRDLPSLYSAMDVLALPSKDEGTPVAVIEALAAEVPVVARDVGGVGEVLEGGRWGRLVDDEDPEAFAEALADVLGDPPGATEREAARRRVLERFDLDRLVRDLETLYTEALREVG